MESVVLISHPKTSDSSSCRAAPQYAALARDLSLIRNLYPLATASHPDSLPMICTPTLGYSPGVLASPADLTTSCRGLTCLGGRMLRCGGFESVDLGSLLAALIGDIGVGE